MQKTVLPAVHREQVTVSLLCCQGCDDLLAQVIFAGKTRQVVPVSALPKNIQVTVESMKSAEKPRNFRGPSMEILEKSKEICLESMKSAEKLRNFRGPSVEILEKPKEICLQSVKSAEKTRNFRGPSMEILEKSKEICLEPMKEDHPGNPGKIHSQGAVIPAARDCPLRG